MSLPPLISVITPTWRRPGLLLNRCLPSVQKQDWPAVEHIIVSDGPDPELRAQLRQPRIEGRSSRWYLELPAHDPAVHWGHRARLYGIEYCSGSFIAYCDDDDALRPDHCVRLATALEAHPEAGWARSLMAVHGPSGSVTEFGTGPPSSGNVGTPMLMHRREILEYGTWGPASLTEDWDLVNRWVHACIPYVTVDAVTSDVWPSKQWHS